MHALRLAWLNIQQKVCTSDSNIYQPLIKADRIWGKSIGGTNSIVFAVSPSGLYSRAYNWSCFIPKHLESYWSADMMKINYSFSLLGLISNTVACTLLCLSYSSLHWLCVLFHGLSSKETPERSDTSKLNVCLTRWTYVRKRAWTKWVMAV